MMDQATSSVSIVFTPSGIRGQFPVGTSIMDAARQLGVDLSSICGGRGLCGRCICEPVPGHQQKYAINSRPEHLTTISEGELSFRARRGLEEGLRLACRTHLLGDMVIAVPEESQEYCSIIRKSGVQVDIPLQPVIRLHYCELPEPGLESNPGEEATLVEALRTQWNFPQLRLHPQLLPLIQRSLRDAEYRVTAAIRDGCEIVALWPGFRDHVYGAAIDIGSTTMAVYLYDLVTGKAVYQASAMNPQIRYGEDLMSRVSYAMMHPEGANRMTSAVHSVLNKLLREACEQADVDPEDCLELVLVGNPVMHHLMLGISPVELGQAPFPAATCSWVDLPARDLDLVLNPLTRASFLPLIAGHVGADTAAMLLSQLDRLDERVTLLVDIGTNAEIVLAQGSRLYSTSSPTGPAFEGAEITCGMRAATGAIERVRIEPATGRVKFRIIGCEHWSDTEAFQQRDLPVAGICGSGIIEALAEMARVGVLDRSGALVTTRALPGLIRINTSWRYYLGDPASSKIFIQQSDIRAIQLAKAALHAGVRLLMDALGCKQLQRVLLAGAFGSHIDPEYAIAIGLFPEPITPSADISAVESIGNAAGTGATMALLNEQYRHIIRSKVLDVNKIESALAPAFQDYFVSAMAFPEAPEAMARPGRGHRRRTRARA